MRPFRAMISSIAACTVASSVRSQKMWLVPSGALSWRLSSYTL